MTNPVRNPEVLLKDVGGESLLYHNGKKEVHILNPTARLIWDLCDGLHSPEKMEQSLRDHFSMNEKHNIADDVTRTLELFYAKGLITGKISDE